MAFALHKNWNKIFKLWTVNRLLALAFILAGDDDTLERLVKGWPECFTKRKSKLTIPVPASLLRNLQTQLSLDDEGCLDGEYEWWGACYKLGLPILGITYHNSGYDGSADIHNGNELRVVQEHLRNKEYRTGMEAIYRDVDYLVIQIQDNPSIGELLDDRYEFIALVPAALIDLNS